MMQGMDTAAVVASRSSFYILRAQCYEKSNQLQAAATDLVRVLKMSPSNR